MEQIPKKSKWSYQIKINLYEKLLFGEMQYEKLCQKPNAVWNKYRLKRKERNKSREEIFY